MIKKIGDSPFDTPVDPNAPADKEAADAAAATAKQDKAQDKADSAFAQHEKTGTDASYKKYEDAYDKIPEDRKPGDDAAAGADAAVATEAKQAADAEAKQGKAQDKADVAFAQHEKTGSDASYKKYETAYDKIPEDRMPGGKPDEYLFDPSRPSSYETSRDTEERHAWQMRLRLAQEAHNRAVEADRLALEAYRTGRHDADEKKAAAEKAHAEAAELHSQVAPKPKPR